MNILPEFILNETYAYTEGNTLEFKQNFNKSIKDKYIETVCAFINTDGGRLIFGIKNCGLISGCYIYRAELDSILLFFDQMNQHLFSENGESFDSSLIKSKITLIAKDTYIIEIICQKKSSEYKYQKKDGKCYIRNNAGNTQIKMKKLYSHEEYDLILGELNLAKEENLRVQKTIKSQEKEHKVMSNKLNNLKEENINLTKAVKKLKNDNENLQLELDTLLNDIESQKKGNCKYMDITNSIFVTTAMFVIPSLITKK